jgi:hypothetical protein
LVEHEHARFYTIDRQWTSNSQWCRTGIASLGVLDPKYLLSAYNKQPSIDAAHRISTGDTVDVCISLLNEQSSGDAAHCRNQQQCPWETSTPVEMHALFDEQSSNDAAHRKHLQQPSWRTVAPVKMHSLFDDQPS